MSPIWIERGGAVALLQLFEEADGKCRNIAAMLISTLLAPEGRRRDEKLKGKKLENEN